MVEQPPVEVRHENHHQLVQLLVAFYVVAAAVQLVVVEQTGEVVMP